MNTVEEQAASIQLHHWSWVFYDAARNYVVLNVNGLVLNYQALNPEDTPRLYELMKNRVLTLSAMHE